MAKESRENNKKIILTMLIITVVLALVVIVLYLQRDLGYDNLNCNQLIEESNLISQSENYCSVDSDCIIETKVIMHTCGCYEAVNKNRDLNALLEKVIKINKIYEQKTCPIAICEPCEVPSQDKVKCAKGKCVVEGLN